MSENGNDETGAICRIGTGAFRLHSRKKKLALNNDVQLAHVADTLEGRAEQVAGELHVAKWSADPSEVFNDPSIDAVIIATPTGTHAEMIKSAAKSGKHIFVEKPVTRTLEEADEVISIVQEHRVHCMVGFMRRFDPAFVDAKKKNTIRRNRQAAFI